LSQRHRKHKTYSPSLGEPIQPAEKPTPSEEVKREVSEPVSNWFLVAFTALLFLASLFQWSVMKGQLQAMVDAERPWIGSISYFADPIEANKEGTAKVIVINSGKGPARILSFRTELRIFPSFPKEPTYGANTPTWMNLSQTILLPGMTATNEFPFSKVDPTIFQLVLDGNARLYVYGILEYEDLRVAGSKHTTKMCAYWTAKKIQTPFVNCPEYNEAN
jgi:hypothetical protein